MSAVKKFVLGIRPANKMFRVESLKGLLVDAFLEARGKEISESYYTSIAETGAAPFVALQNEEEGNYLIIDRDNVVFTKSKYKTNSHVDLDEAIGEFRKIWNIAQKIINLKGIRRIGYVAEHRITPNGNNNAELLKALTKISGKEFPFGFNLHFESRAPSKGSTSVDIEKGRFTNVIYDYYDSAMDSAEKEPNKINANIDYQKYFMPLIDTGKFDEMEKVFFEFKKELAKFEAELVKLGLSK